MVNMCQISDIVGIGQALLKVCACFCVSTYSHIYTNITMF